MTNYEWLVETNKLAELIEDVADEEVTTKSFFKKWGVSQPSDRDKVFGEVISDWLQVEHKRNVYLCYEDINDFIVKLAKTGEIPISCAQKITDELPFFKTKEIIE